MTKLILPGLLALCLGGGLFWQQARLEKAEAHIARLEAELTAARNSAEQWKLALKQARATQEAQARQAQACLEREAAARLEAERWRNVMARMRTREMTKEEKTGVPDDATRRALLEFLDAPF